MKAAAKRWGVSRVEELLPCGATSLVMFSMADIIIQIGNGFAVQALIDEGVSHSKIMQFHYAIQHIQVTDDDRMRDGRRFLHLASGLGLRKGLPETLDLFERCSQHDWQLSIIGGIYNTANKSYWEERIADFVAVHPNAHYWPYIDSAEQRYQNLLTEHAWLLFPTIEEAEPGTVIEAMSLGVVPLLTPSGSGIDFSVIEDFDASIQTQFSFALNASTQQWYQASQRAKHYVETFHNYDDWESRLLALFFKIRKGQAMKPHVTIVLPIHNKQAYISRLLKDLWHTTKTYPHWDLYIIYDGCTDATRVRAAKVLRKFNVPVHELVTADIFENRSNNLGLQAAQGEYCVILQDDNFLFEPFWLEQMISWLEAHPRVAVLGGLAGVNFYPLGVKPSGPGTYVGEQEVYQRRDWRLQPKLFDTVYEVDAVMRGPTIFRKDLLEEHGYLDEAYAPFYNDDMDYCFRMRNLGYSIFCYPIRVENKSLTVARYDSEKAKFWLQVLEKNQLLFYSRWSNQMADHDEYIHLPKPHVTIRPSLKARFRWLRNSALYFSLQALPAPFLDLARPNILILTAARRMLRLLSPSMLLVLVSAMSWIGSCLQSCARLIHIHTLQTRAIPWYAIDGDATLRLNYNLDHESTVFDLGGYTGEWASKIYNKYGCRLWIFEPVPSFAQIIRERFEHNARVQVFQFGLSNIDQSTTISLEGNASSIFTVSSKESIQIDLLSISNFLNKNNILNINLMKVNIEGGEYDLLESLITSGSISSIDNIQIQFHDFMPDARIRMKAIQDRLKDTHQLTYQYEFVWENWQRKILTT